MAAATPTQEPTQVRAGETLTFKRSLSDYPASEGWNITYTFVGPGKITFTSTADGNAHSVSVSATDTAGYLAGDYEGSGLATKAGEKHEVYTGRLTVKPDFAASEEGTDFRSQNRRILDKINAAIEGRAGHDILNSDIEGTKIERMSPEQLLELRDRYAQLVAEEEASLSGKSTRRNVLIRFT